MGSEAKSRVYAVRECLPIVKGGGAEDCPKKILLKI